MESKVIMSWILSGDVDGEMIGGQWGTEPFFCSLMGALK
jgi:hypothetical protein